MYDIVKTEFVFEETFANVEDLQSKLGAWVWRYNKERIHSSLGYITPVESCEIAYADNPSNANREEFILMVDLKSKGYFNTAKKNTD